MSEKAKLVLLRMEEARARERDGNAVSAIGTATIILGAATSAFPVLSVPTWFSQLLIYLGVGVAILGAVAGIYCVKKRTALITELEAMTRSSSARAISLNRRVIRAASCSLSLQVGQLGRRCSL